MSMDVSSFSFYSLTYGVLRILSLLLLSASPCLRLVLLFLSGLRVKLLSFSFDILLFFFENFFFYWLFFSCCCSSWLFFLFLHFLLLQFFLLLPSLHVFGKHVLNNVKVYLFIILTVYLTLRSCTSVAAFEFHQEPENKKPFPAKGLF